MGFARQRSIGVTVVLAAGMAAGFGLACSLPGAFSCTDDDQCVRGGVSGRCESSGFCSFPDDACESSSRYGDKAPANLAGMCVEPPDATEGLPMDPSTGATSATGTSGSDSAGTEATTDGEGSGPISACGNGAIDPGEACDDGNAVDSDGCNVDCVVSGSLLWSTTFVGTGRGFDRANSVAVTRDGGLIVAARVFNDDQDGVVHRFDDDRITWTFLLDGGPDDECREAIVLPDGSIAVAGILSAPGLPTTPWIATLDANGDLVWEDSGMDAGLDGGARGVAAGPDGVIATGGLLGDDAFVQVYDADGALLWNDQIVAPAPESSVHGLVYRGDTLHVVGWRASLATDRDFWVRAYDPAGMMVWDDTYDGGQRGSSDDRFHAAVLLEDSVVAVGRTGIQAGNQVVGARYDASGNALEPLLDQTRNASSAVDAVAMPNGDLVVVGWESPDGAEPTVGWARRYDLAGELRWETSIGEPDVGGDWLGGVALLDTGELVVVGSLFEGSSHAGFIGRLAP